MKRLKTYALGLATTATILMLLLASFGPNKVSASRRVNLSVQSNITVFATGLNNPRGLKFGPDGNLYVAEGGTGGTDSTVGICDQVPFPVGPYTGSATGGRISIIDQSGNHTTFTYTLPSSQTCLALFSLISCIVDVACVGDTLYGILAGACCSHGISGTPNG